MVENPQALPNGRGLTLTIEGQDDTQGAESANSTPRGTPQKTPQKTPRKIKPRREGNMLYNRVLSRIGKNAARSESKDANWVHLWFLRVIFRPNISSASGGQASALFRVMHSSHGNMSNKWSMQSP
ncbi:hypothetical protein H0G86_009032 [Trichoderma simmonsii]|uniref:Uncharacterized protein n=1 Tax=Trichoderma simmonsii TaxID=1491479 RepID=A0A8G0LLZ3_9HYPO|nr:hypothetical protein H0G86_009032 [Trichoderma simmonsii]